MNEKSQQAIGAEKTAEIIEEQLKAFTEMCKGVSERIPDKTTRAEILLHVYNITEQAYILLLKRFKMIIENEL